MRSLNRTVALVVLLLPAAALGQRLPRPLRRAGRSDVRRRRRPASTATTTSARSTQHTPHAAPRNDTDLRGLPRSWQPARGWRRRRLHHRRRRSLKALDARGRAQLCLQCHGGVGAHWQDGPHAGTEISCADCHADQAHFGGAARPLAEFRNRGEFCLQCHPQQATDFRLPSRHRVLEGEVSCLDCHDAARRLRPGRLERPQRGLPRLPHRDGRAPSCSSTRRVSDEDCTACHRPHGSQHDKLLTQDGNGLCLQCHVDAHLNATDGWEIGDQSHAGLLLNEGRCYDCHTHVHGSNVSPTLRDQ